VVLRVLRNSGYGDPITEYISEVYGPEGSVVTKRIDYIAGPPRLVSRYNLDRLPFHSGSVIHFIYDAA
jgi:hypothetical protein